MADEDSEVLGLLREISGRLDENRRSLHAIGRTLTAVERHVEEMRESVARRRALLAAGNREGKR